MNNTKKITDAQIAAAARRIGVEPAALKAFALVESNGGGFSSTGRCKILFEGHIFWRQLRIYGINPLIYARQNPSILFEVRDKTKNIGGDKEYSRLALAQVIHNEAALKATSWGMFQIMGFNHKVCGYDNVKDFVKAMQESELNQLLAVIKFLGGNILPVLKTKNWKAVASMFNGPAYAENNYDVKFDLAYNKSLYMNKL